LDLSKSKLHCINLLLRWLGGLRPFMGTCCLDLDLKLELGPQKLRLGLEDIRTCSHWTWLQHCYWDGIL